MMKRLLLLFTLFSCASAVNNTIFVNTTNAVCMAAVGSVRAVLVIRLDSKEILRDTKYQDYVSFNISDSIKDRSNFTREQQSCKLCIDHTVAADAGLYTFDISPMNYVWLYVLDKPTTPAIYVVTDGIVNYTTAEIQCNSSSTSAPSGFDIMYIWKVDGKLIEPSNKYSYTDVIRSGIVVEVEPKDIFSSYTCVAMEEFGQISEPSNNIKINPKSPAVVTILPSANPLKIIEHRILNLSCATTGANPAVQSRKWYRNNTILVGVTAENYILQNVTRHDSGTYNCTASNGIAIDGSDTTRLDVLYGPVIYQMSNKSQLEGLSLTITCDIQSNPRASDDNVTWTKQGNASFIRKGVQLLIPNLNRIDNGTFICSVNIILQPTIGSSDVRSATEDVEITVLYGPVITSMSKISQEEGHNVTIFCEIDSNPRATDDDVVWRKQGNSSFIRNGQKLSIPNVNKKDNGTFVCSVRMLFQSTTGQVYEQSASEDIGLDILYGPLISQMNTISELEGHNVTITCDIQSNPTATDDNVTWTKQGNTSFIRKGLQLFIPNVNRLDNGKFVCSVRIIIQPNIRSSSERSAQEDVEINILYGPTITHMTTFSQQEGHKLSVACDITSNPRAADDNVTWTKQGNSSFIRKGIQLSIPNVNRMDNGTFVCSVSIILQPTTGTIDVKSAMEDVGIDILYQAHADLLLSNMTLYEGNSTNVTCEVDSNPLADVSWIYLPNNTQINDTYVISDSFNKLSSVLYFQFLGCEETGSYLCLASNGIKSPHNDTVNLYVHCKPRIAERNKSEQNKTIGRNESLDLTVWFHAFPPPSFKWHFNQSILSSTETAFSITNITDQLPFKFGSRLQKNKVDATDIGTYMVIASNIIGQGEAIYYIDFQRQPDKPVIVSYSCMDAPATAIISWKQGWNGGIPQEFTVIYKLMSEIHFTPGGSYVKEQMDEQYTFPVKYLLPSRVYVFKVVASNTIGTAESETVNCTTIEDIQETNNQLATVGVATGSVLGILAFIIVFGIVIYGRRTIKQREKPSTLVQSSEEDTHISDACDDGLKDNVCYVSADQVLPNVSGDEYAVVHKKCIRKTFLHNPNQDSEFVRQKAKGDVYENMERKNDIQMTLVQISSSRREHKPKKNKDGLIYADLDLKTTYNTYVVHGVENRTNYADIDLTKKADPLPSDDSDDNTQTNST